VRVLLVDQYSELGGGQRCLIEAAAGFAARGWDVHAAFPAPGTHGQEPGSRPLADALSPICDEIYPIPCGPFTSTRKSPADAIHYATQLPRQIAILRRILRRARDVDREIDVLYVNGPRVLPAAALARGATPVIFHAHWDVTQPAASALILRAVRMSQAHIVASSRSVARPWGRVVPTDKISVVYNGVSLRSAAGQMSLSPRGTIRRIAVLGRIAPEKGQLEFVRSAHIVAARAAPGLRFSVYGAPLFADDCYFTQVRAEAAGCPIEFPGWTDHTAAAFAGIDLLVVPSDPTDNIPRVIMEAFAARVPVIAFPSGGIPELIEHGVTGILADGRKPEDLAGAILAAVAQPERMNAIADRAFDLWRERYTLERFQSEVCGVVEDVVRRHHQRMPRASASVDPAA
jgi:glycosyltransferase involved in cell wall biosynthesis